VKLRMFVAVIAMLAMASANASLIRVSQETAAGAGDFDSNVLGFISTYETTLTVAGFYSYNNGPNGASYNGELNGGPTPVSQMSQSFFVNGSDGLALVQVHDAANDGSGGSTTMQWILSGDTAAEVLADDPGEPIVVSAGGTQFDSTKNWIGCCTDGYAIGMLDGDWAMTGGFQSFVGLGQWRATSADGNDIALDDALRVRFQTVPAPGVLGLLSVGLLGLGLMRRRRRTA
jgi:hypothetical protein